MSSDKQLPIIQTVGCIYERDGHDTLFIYQDSYTIWVSPDSTVVVAACKVGLSTNTRDYYYIITENFIVKKKKSKECLSCRI